MELDFSKKIHESDGLKKILAEEKSRKQINNLPDSDFAYIEPGGKRVDGKTVPRSLRRFPVYNEIYIKRSIAEVGKSSLSTEGKAEVYAIIEAKASVLGVEVDEDTALGAERYDGKTRSELEDSVFLDPKRRSFPVVSCKNVRAAVSTWGMYKGPMSFEEFKRKLTARAKKLGCESSLPKTWRDESSAKDWDKIDKDELKHDDKKEKKEHYKDAVKDDEEHIDKLKKDEKIDKEKESKAATDKQKAARDKFMEMIRKKKGGDKDDKKSDDKDDKKSDDKDDKKSKASSLDMEKEYAPVPAGSRLVKRNEADWEKTDKKELKRDDKKEKREHEEDALKDDKKQVKDLKKDEKEDKKSLEKATAPMGCPECY